MNILVFQERGSGEQKTAAVKSLGKNIIIQDVISVDVFLPDFIDEPEDYIDAEFTADLVLNYFRHPDLVDYLVKLCEAKQIPVISPGKKCAGFTPFTCCGLGKNKVLGEYGEQFGLPEYEIRLENGRISEIVVVRGAPCGASLKGIEGLIGCDLEEALTRLPRQVQYFCSADPSGFDPVTGKSPVHYAGYVHIAALTKAVERQKL